MNHLSDEFTHSTVASEAAKDSPTVQLVRYLIDLAHELGVVDDSHSTQKVLMHAHHFLTNAEDGLIADDFIDDNLGLLEEAGAVIADLTNLLPGSSSLYSFVINWNDRDTEEGTFGTTVRALNGTHAEYLARAEMETSEGRGYDFTGSVVDQNVGATWKADDLERSLRGMVKAMGLLLKVREGDPAADAEVRIASGEIDKANALLAEIDAL